MKLYIIEGPDNTGKSTLIDEIKEHYERRGEIVKNVHCGKPNGTGQAAAQYQDLYFKQLVQDLIGLSQDKETSVVILDRGWHGEAVYGALYRGRDKYPLNASLQKMILDCDSKIVDFGIDTKLVLITVDDVKFLQRHEDGLSISGAKTENLINECELFEDVFNHSVLPNKTKVVVNNGLEFRSKEDIFREVI